MNRVKIDIMLFYLKINLYFAIQSTFIMEKNLSSAEELKTIRKMMEESTKFLSLSGFSGVLLGFFAIAGAVVARYLILGRAGIGFDEYIEGISGPGLSGMSMQFTLTALLVLLLSLASAFYFSFRKVRRSGRSIWTPVSKRLLTNLMIPLVAGGLFVLIFLIHGHLELVIPGLLVFYGLALVNAGKFTYSEIFYLGIIELITGLVAGFFPALGLIFWIFGFGLLHIVYGLFMFRKYEA
jgi:hypothetical protein